MSLYSAAGDTNIKRFHFMDVFTVFLISKG